MNSPAQLLAPLQFPLHGNSLIEASAGTGKTFTIAALYLRLVLDHGADARFGRRLMPPDILVVAFTEAATKELRDRIRARLAVAAQAFQHESAQVEDLLGELRASYPREQWSECARLLQAAAEWMDEAAVSTIHGWCNRMLREHAFDSGSLFEQTLVTDLEELIDEAVRDYWRTYFYNLDAQDAEGVRAWWSSVDAFTHQLRMLLVEAQHLPEGNEPRQALQAARVESERQLQALKAAWKPWSDELRELLQAACDRGAINSRHRRHVMNFASQLGEWAEGDTRWPMEAKSKGWERLTPAGLAEVWVADPPLEHPALAAMPALKSALERLPDGKEALLGHAARWVADRVGRTQRRLAQMGFDDLLAQLHAALHRPITGERLAQTIREQFPVALIDEFQDTDPVQYGIFRKIYGAQGTPARSALILIGDPKQAIYAFRGADIYTYLQARRDTAGRHFTLGMNYRSSTAMVDAVNRLFTQAEERAGAGAFRFRAGHADPLPFAEVRAQGRSDVLCVQGTPAPALSCWWSEPQDYKATMAQACAAEIVRLLQLAQQGQAGFRQDDGAWHPLHPRDIAVLVNSRQEAEAVRAELSRGGVRSVYLSDRDSVFDSPAAGELQRLLQACAAPEDGARVRAALGTPLLALSWAELDALGEDELLWERRIEQFRAYLQQWRRQGVLPMVRRLLNDFEVPRRLLAIGDERQLTDLLHLAELLQQASALLQGEHALVRHLAEERVAGSALGESRQVRLESDADLLKVVTVHKSKGLQYPLVFLPFPCTCWPVKANSAPIKYHDEHGALRITLSASDAEIRQADEERLGEDLRKLYVALTRAVHATWIGVAPTPDLARTALGHLLEADNASVESLQERLCASGAVVVPAPQALNERWQPPGAATESLAAPLVAKAARERWWIASYSRLSGSMEAARAPESAEEANYEEGAAQADDARAALVDPPAGTLHAFARGAAAGTFLHGLLEWAGQQGFSRLADAGGEIEAGIARRCLSPAWQVHRPMLQDWLQRWLVAPLQLPGATAIVPARLGTYQVEMEFWFPARAVNVRSLDQLVSRHTLGGAARPAVGAVQLNGMLKGFIDLTFEHEGRYYVADYKSNWLGAGDTQYTARAMHDEVLAQRYELQYCLYLLALHRLLRARLRDYDYDRHIGGAIVLFLRGHAAATQGLHMERPPRTLMDALDVLFQGEREEEAA